MEKSSYVGVFRFHTKLGSAPALTGADHLHLRCGSIDSELHQLIRNIAVYKRTNQVFFLFLHFDRCGHSVSR